MNASEESKVDSRERNAIQHKSARINASEESKVVSRAENTRSRRVIRNNYSDHRLMIESATSIDQEYPPDGEELLFHERDVINSLLMYHHLSGVEFVEPAYQYVELRFGIFFALVLFVCRCRLFQILHF